MRYQAALRSDSSYSNLFFDRFWLQRQIFLNFSKLAYYEKPVQSFRDEKKN